MTASAAILRVKHDAEPGGTGASWPTAFNNIQAAIDEALANSDEIDQIWVAAGEYNVGEGAANPTDTSNTLLITKGISLLGHFHGDETDPDERVLSDPADETILSGDLDEDDTPGEYALDLANAWNIITVSGVNGPVSDATIISDLTLEHGYASCTSTCVEFEIANCVNTNTAELALGGGGAIQCVDGASPRIERCRFRDNVGQNGGAMRISNCSSPLIVRCRFERNFAEGGNGGAIFFCDRGSGNVVNCEFVGNTCGHVGGAVAGRHTVPADAEFANCVFVGNQAGDWGGAVRGGTDAGFLFTNCTFTANAAGPGQCGDPPQPAAGGAIAVGASPSLPTGDRSFELENCIVWGNVLIDDPQDGFDPAGGEEIAFTRAATVRVTNSNVRGGEDGVLTEYEIPGSCCTSNCSYAGTLL